MLRYAPLGIFFILLIFLYLGLGLNPRQLDSTFIGKEAPLFILPRLGDPAKTISNKDLIGKVWILNVWASWCVSCRAEHPLLMQLAKQPSINLYGLNYKDTLQDATNWLARHGNPYRANAFDEKGRTGIDYGVTGTPETFVIDQQGVVRYKHVGPLDAQILTQSVWPVIQKLQNEPEA